MGTTKHTRRISILARAPLHRLKNRGVRKSLVPIAGATRAVEKQTGSRLGAIALRHKIKNLPQKKLAFHQLVSEIVQEKTTEASQAHGQRHPAPHRSDAFPPPRPPLDAGSRADPFGAVCLAASAAGIHVPDLVAVDPDPMVGCAGALADRGERLGALEDEVCRMRLEREVRGLANADRLRSLASRLAEARGALLGATANSPALRRRLKGASFGRLSVPVEIDQQGAFLGLLDVLRWEGEKVNALAMDWRWLEAHASWSSTLWQDNLGSILGASQAIAEKITDGEALVSAFDRLLTQHHATGSWQGYGGAQLSNENAKITSRQQRQKCTLDKRKQCCKPV